MLQFDEEVIAWTCNNLQKDDSLLRNYWNKTKYIWLNNRENIRERWVTFKRIIHGYNHWKELKNSKPTDFIYINVCVCVCVTTQQQNKRERCVTIKRIIQMLKLLKGQKILKNHKIYFL